MADANAALVVLFGVPVSVLLATAGLAQFKAVFVALTSLSQRRGGVRVLQKGTGRPGMFS